MGQDTFENVSYLVYKKFKVSYIFDASKCAANYRDIFEVYDGFIGHDGFIGQKTLKI